jgi:hypothetical protein
MKSAIVLALALAGVLAPAAAPAQSKVQVQPDATVVIVNTQSLNVHPSVVGPSPATVMVRTGQAQQPSVSGPLCGGVINGVPQAACGAKPAKFESKALGTCPSGSFLDIVLWQCWKCPAGYDRTLAGVTTERACGQRDSSVRGELGRAQFKGSLCPAGAFFDPIRDGECWSCPAGFERSVFTVEGDTACHLPGREQLFRAVRYNKGTGLIGTDCPGGQFWDGIDGFCYSCEGARRTGSSVRSDDSCARVVPEAWARARIVKKAGCDAGEIQDPRNGGECWRCPQSWDRTVYPIQESQACEKGGGMRFAKATYEAALTCPASQLFDFVDGGTCWSCPAGYKRGLVSVKSPTACVAGTIDWFTAPYPHPGLFGLPGGEASALEALRERQMIEDAFAEVATGLGKPLAEVRKKGWSEIAKEPENSSVLRAVVLSRLVEALQGKAPMTPALQQLAASFAEHVRQYRTYVAKDALAAYDAWKAADEYWRLRAAKNPQSMTMMADFGTVPPDFQEIVGTGNAVGLAAGGAFGTMATMSLAQPGVKKAIFPYVKSKAARLDRARNLKAMNKIGSEVIKTTERTAPKAGFELGGDLVAGFMAAGPQIIIMIAIEIISKGVEQFEEIRNARPKLETAVATAGQPVDLRRMLASDEGIDDVMAMWSMAVSGSTPPGPAAKLEITAIATK